MSYEGDVLLLALLSCSDADRVVVSHLAPEVAARVDAVAAIVDACADGAFAIVDDGAIVHEVAWGPEPSLAKRYVWASVSKPITATIVLRLVEAGRVSLDTPIVELAPAYTGLVPTTDPPLTLTHLLSHTGGVTRVEHRHKPGMFMRPPGVAYRYSTNGYGIVGDVIAAVTGEPYARAVAALGEVAGMPSMTAGAAWATPGALVRGDVGDLARFTARLMDHTLLSEPSFARMATPIGRLADDTTPPSPGSKAEMYGMGLQISADRRVLAHAGRNDAERAFVYLRPAENRAFVAVCTARRASELLAWWPTGEAVLGALP